LAVVEEAGIALKLIAYVLQVARSRSFELAFAETSGRRSLHVFCDKAGFTEIQRADWKSFLVQVPESPLNKLADRGQALVELKLCSLVGKREMWPRGGCLAFMRLCFPDRI